MVNAKVFYKNPEFLIIIRITSICSHDSDIKLESFSSSFEYSVSLKASIQSVLLSTEIDDKILFFKAVLSSSFFSSTAQS